VSIAIIVTARCRRDNCANGLPGAWFCASETRHYIAPRSLPGVMMSRGQTAEPAGQPPGLCVTPLAQPWVGGGSKRAPSATTPTPVPGSRRRNKLEAARALAGRRSFFFQQAAPGAACFSGAEVRVRQKTFGFFWSITSE